MRITYNEPNILGSQNDAAYNSWAKLRAFMLLISTGFQLPVVYLIGFGDPSEFDDKRASSCIFGKGPQSPS